MGDEGGKTLVFVGSGRDYVKAMAKEKQITAIELSVNAKNADTISEQADTIKEQADMIKALQEQLEQQNK